MNKKQKLYILNNWSAYNLVDSKEDMIKLLNILEAHEENLDSLHDVQLQGYTCFCGIVGTFEDDKSVVNALFDFDVFFENEEGLFQFAKNQVENIYSEEDRMSPEEYLEDEDIRKTSDGYVLVLYY